MLIYQYPNCMFFVMETTEVTKNIPLNKNYITSPISWDQYFMLQAILAGFKSKDPSTKVGSIIVDNDNRQVSMGYNGFIAGIDEGRLTWNKDKNDPFEDQKYGYVVHSEANAILVSSRSLKGCRMYVTLFPCNECAKLIASKKLSEVIFLTYKESHKESNNVAKKIFDLCNIKYRQLTITEEIIESLKNHINTVINYQ